MKFLCLTLGIAALAGSAMAQTHVASSALVILNPSAQGALAIVGNSRVTIPAASVYVNSQHEQAVVTNGVAVLRARELFVRGGVNFTGGSHCTGSVFTKINTVYEDPCAVIGASFPQPGSNPLPVQDVKTVVNLSPGYYAGLSVSGNGDLRLAPGVYHIGAGGFTSNGGRIIGQDVTIFVHGGKVDLGGNGFVNLRAPSTGAYQGMLLMQCPTNTNPMSLAGTADFNLDGVIYVPKAKLTMVGTSTVEGTGPQIGNLVVADQVELRGTAEIRIGSANATSLSIQNAPLFD
jgi:hypothetical protein